MIKPAILVLVIALFGALFYFVDQANDFSIVRHPTYSSSLLPQSRISQYFHETQPLFHIISTGEKPIAHSPQLISYAHV